MVDVPWLGSALNVDPTAWESVRTQVFEQGRPPDELLGISLKPAILEAADVVDGPVFLQGVTEARVELALECEGQRAKATFDLRRVSDERAYTHPVGISVVISDARRHGKHWCHELQSRIFLGQQRSGRRGTFFRSCNCCVPGAAVIRRESIWPYRKRRLGNRQSRAGGAGIGEDRGVAQPGFERFPSQ